MVAIACGDRRDYEIHVMVPQNQWLTPLPPQSPWQPIWAPSMLDPPYLPPTPPEVKIATMGWTCPKCGKVYSPSVDECGNCNGVSYFVGGAK